MFSKDRHPTEGSTQRLLALDEAIEAEPGQIKAIPRQTSEALLPSGEQLVETSKSQSRQELRPRLRKRLVLAHKLSQEKVLGPFRRPKKESIVEEPAVREDSVTVEEEPVVGAESATVKG
ncbi:uncharacterized protein A4U43_C07F21270 [Asparagus officinalis]|uniref:Uncharacterized protein n=1 Tax=Asparagus officinalis TaxID=4686 RepID=A0A5P1EGS2_ASPOF|nr:uncharacterized protein A4U43_C07F21270 [Asparagus officinalis]